MKKNITKNVCEKSDSKNRDSSKIILKCKFCNEELLDRLDFEQHSKSAHETHYEK